MDTAPKAGNEQTQHQGIETQVADSSGHRRRLSPLAQKAHMEVDTIRNARHAELLQLARQVELLSRIRVASQFSNPLAYYQAWQNWDEEFSKM